MKKYAYSAVNCVLLTLLMILSFNEMAKAQSILYANKTPMLKPYDFSAEYDGVKGPVKEVIAFEGKINRKFGNETLVKGHPIGCVKYLPNGLRMEAGESSQYEVKYCFNNNQLDSIFYHYDYNGTPRTKKTFEYISQDSIVEKCFEKEYNGWEQISQANIKLIPGGYKCLYYPDKESEAEFCSYIFNGSEFKYAEGSYLYANPLRTNNSIFRYDRLSLIKRQSTDYGKIASGEITLDDFGRIIRIRPSQKERETMLKNGDSYIATHVEYDENGSIIKIVDSHYYPGPILNRRWKHVGDEVIKIEYNYDAHGNWTLAKMTTYNQSWDKDSASYGEERDKEESYFIREISYYSGNDTTPEFVLGKIHEERVAQEEAKRLCYLAYKACGYWVHNRGQDNLSGLSGGSAMPLALGGLKNPSYTQNNIKIEQLKSFEINGDSYTFVKNDKTIVPDVHFTRRVSDLDPSYHNCGFLSDDKKNALIIYRNSVTEDYLYFIEFEGNDVKSISYIPYEKSKDFVIPKISNQLN